MLKTEEFRGSNQEFRGSKQHKDSKESGEA
jgi:hypothetical protein